MTWDPAQYLKFAGERMRPALDLLARVPLAAPRSGRRPGLRRPATSRGCWAARWPAGGDHRRRRLGPMLAARRRGRTGGRALPMVPRPTSRAGSPSGRAASDLVFSNAALHWLDDHARLFPRLLRRSRGRGRAGRADARQFRGAVARRVADVGDGRRAGASASARRCGRRRWRRRRILRWLAPRAASIDLGSTEYLHVLPAGDGIEHPVVAWTRGLGATPVPRVARRRGTGGVSRRLRRPRSRPPIRRGRRTGSVSVQAPVHGCACAQTSQGATGHACAWSSDRSHCRWGDGRGGVGFERTSWRPAQSGEVVPRGLNHTLYRFSHVHS